MGDTQRLDPFPRLAGRLVLDALVDLRPVPSYVKLAR
jgi:hypothetical protein